MRRGRGLTLRQREGRGPTPRERGAGPDSEKAGREPLQSCGGVARLGEGETKERPDSEWAKMRALAHRRGRGLTLRARRGWSLTLRRKRGPTRSKGEGPDSGREKGEGLFRKKKGGA